MVTLHCRPETYFCPVNCFIELVFRGLSAEIVRDCFHAALVIYDLAHVVQVINTNHDMIHHLRPSAYYCLDQGGGAGFLALFSFNHLMMPQNDLFHLLSSIVAFIINSISLY